MPNSDSTRNRRLDDARFERDAAGARPGGEIRAGMSLDEMLDSIENIARHRRDDADVPPRPLYRPPSADARDAHDARTYAPQTTPPARAEAFEASLQISRRLIEKELEARRMEETLQLAAVNTAYEILESEIEKGRLNAQPDRQAPPGDIRRRAYGADMPRAESLRAARLPDESGVAAYGIESGFDNGTDAPSPAEKAAAESLDAPGRKHAGKKGRLKKERVKKNGEKPDEASPQRNKPEKRAAFGLNPGPGAGRIRLVALLCVCAFFVTATVRILFIPTEETVYQFDDSSAQYLITDDYIPPATMAVITGVSWQESDALSILETATVLSETGASLLDQADTPAKSTITAVVRVYMVSTGQVVEMDLEEYLIGVVAAEMPASYQYEALKAQAVAARTYTVRRMASLGGTPDGRGGDICTDPGHCQAYYTTDELRARWGSNFDKYYNLIKGAVYDTQGLIITYNGAPINAFYHANSGGMTENCENVFVQALPYLRSVSSPGESAYSSYSSTKTISREEFAATLSSKTGLSIGAADLESQVVVTSRTNAGRIYRISIGGTEYKGTTFQSWFSLRSTNITLSYTDTDVTFTVLGYGHGVGMSQTGANAMAEAGNSYATILKHYYTGVEIEPYQ